MTTNVGVFNAPSRRHEDTGRHIDLVIGLALTRQDHELAAQLFNTCRSKGVQGSNTDF